MLRLIIVITTATFIGVILIVALLIRRRDAPETQKVLDAIEGVRQQNSAEHSALQSEQRSQGNAVRKLLERFGFLNHKG